MSRLLRLRSRSMPDDDSKKVQIYIPHRKTQCLIYDLANVISVETLLKMCRVGYGIHEIENAQFVSNTGYIPFIRYGKFILNDYKSIVKFFSDKLIIQPDSVSRCESYHVFDVEDYKKSKDSRMYKEATMFCLTKQLEDLEKYVSWLDDYTYYNETKPKYSSVYPFPLNHIITVKEYQNLKTYLTEKDLKAGTASEVILNKMKTILNVFSLHLSENFFLVGRKPKAIDALVFGHLNSTLLYRNNDKSALFQEMANYIVSNSNLMVFLETMQKYISY